MVGHYISIILVLLLLCPAGGPAFSKSKEDREAAIRQKVRAIALGSVVTVETANKQRMLGRIGESTEAGFPMQIVRQDKVETVTIAFSDT
ncbi:MAG: hypothetical protein HY820_21180 [Acidobacteria bacterium]|nr:hypothetical protein [Acidobacteriota bacterium]